VNGTWLRIPPEAEVESRTTWTIAVSADQHQLGTAVILLNRPCASVGNLTAAEWMDLHNHLQRLHRALDTLLRPDGYDHDLHMSASNQVYMQVVPRYRSPRTWRGETFEDARGNANAGPAQRPFDPDALEELRDAIRDRLPLVV
jgi:diadenosine tetraphosphate (Ap4A) HIT family hydrolase